MLAVSIVFHIMSAHAALSSTSASPSTGRCRSHAVGRRHRLSANPRNERCRPWKYAGGVSGIRIDTKAALDDATDIAALLEFLQRSHHAASCRDVSKVPILGWRNCRITVIGTRSEVVRFKCLSLQKKVLMNPKNYLSSNRFFRSIRFQSNRNRFNPITCLIVRLQSR